MCPTEIIAFSDAYEKFQALNTELLGASVDSKYSHLSWLKTPRSQGGLGNVNFPLISDIEKKIAETYGVLITEGPDAGVALRGLFIIDPTGTLRQVTINALPVGRSVDETLRLLRAFQYSDESGSVCQAGWTEVTSTPALKPNPDECGEFFKAAYGDE